MKTTRYTPQPIDTSDVKLPIELENLVEEMSKNVHEVWAENRINQGWSYGEQRSEELKTHPCLVPYEQLPELEKEYLISDAFSCTFGKFGLSKILCFITKMHPAVYEMKNNGVKTALQRR